MGRGNEAYGGHVTIKEKFIDLEKRIAFLEQLVFKGRAVIEHGKATFYSDTGEVILTSVVKPTEL
jgi:hypothetical protein